MKKCIPLLFCLICVLQALNADAKVLRVGFFGPPVANVDYGNLTLAIAAAAAGDTIYCFPGGNTGGTFTLTKRLVFIGYGNWLNPGSSPKGNAGMQAFQSTIDIGTIVFSTGSAGSVVMGFSAGTFYIGDASDVVIRRNRNPDIILGHPTNGPKTNNNIQILENYRATIRSYSTGGYNATNLNISNNFINYLSLTSPNTFSGSISNNIWAYSVTEGNAEINSGTNAVDLAGGSFLFQNNIFASYTNATAGSNYNYFAFNGAGNSIFNYNLMISGNNQNSFPSAGTGNVIIGSNNAGSIFEGFPTIGSRSADDRWVLKAGSPALAINPLVSNPNAGMYSGPNPYKLSTIPAIPTIYSLSSPDGNNPAGGTIQINVSTRGNN